jgi:hypothetical protein
MQVCWFSEPSSLGIDSVTARVVTLRYRIMPRRRGHDRRWRNRRFFVFEKQTSSATSRVYGSDLRCSVVDTLRLRRVAALPLEHHG